MKPMGRLPLENAGVMSEHILSVFKAVASFDERGNAQCAATVMQWGI
jgi:hypothetical protein